MSNRILQANVNHSRHGHNMLLQTMAEGDYAVAVVSEPYWVPADHPHWAANPGGTVAITWRMSTNPLPVVPVDAGDHFVVVRWGDLILIGVYLPPSLDMAQCERAIDELERCVWRHQRAPLILAGDFNAKAGMWGSPITDARGRLIQDWITSAGLCCLNTGNASTCIRAQGESIVDVTFANPAAAARVGGWRVTDDETCSDHRYVAIALAEIAAQRRRRVGPRPQRWALRSLDADAFRAAVIAGTWTGRDPPAGDDFDIDAEARRLQALMVRACDASMRRTVPRPRRAMPWWSEDLAHLRDGVSAARRRLKRLRRRAAPDPEETAARLEELRQARDVFAKAITRAKREAWEQFILSLNRDPWGRPYRTVRGRLRRWAAPYTEALEPPVLEAVLAGLFPPLDDGGSDSADGWEEPALPLDGARAWRDGLRVSPEELLRAVKRMTEKRAAPGPSGVPSRAWALAIEESGAVLLAIYNECLRRGVFPAVWKAARLVLLRKPGKPPDSASGYRPICLLEDEAKLLERVIAERLVSHLEGSGPGLHPNQFGFRHGRGTMDAIGRVRRFLDGVYREGGVAIGVSLDVRNAFNAIPWTTIGRALRGHGVPLYLRRVVRDYLSERRVSFAVASGDTAVRPVERGVPQGSVLGPLLWNIGYDCVMRSADVPDGCCIICYADDTLVLASGDDWEEARMNVDRAAFEVLERISDLGLRVAPEKTVAIAFYDRGAAPPAGTTVRVSGVDIRVGAQMKYLGLTLDSRWRFEAHFKELAPRIEGAAAALSGLLPNLRGPNNLVRRLYHNVVGAMALYGAPVWADAVVRSRLIRQTLRATQRKMAGRLIAAYRTTAHSVNTALAGMPPFELSATARREVHDRTVEARSLREDGVVPSDVRERIRREAGRNLFRAWQEWLPERRGVLAALRPQLARWADARIGLPFHATQVLTGHGCFGRYLCRIGREPTERCWHCECQCDTAAHTLRDCPAWQEQRERLTRAIGHDLSWQAVVQALYREEGRRAFFAFCEDVQSRKEAAERLRERDGRRPPPRRR